MAASPYAGPQQVYFGHPASGQIPPHGAVFGFPQHFLPGMGTVSPVMMPHNMQRSRYQQQAVCPLTKIIIFRIHRSFLLPTIMCGFISFSDDPRKCQSQHQVHAECQTRGLPCNAASGLPKCHGVAATRWQQHDSCCSIRWTGRATAGSDGFIHHSVFNTSTNLKVLQYIHKRSSAYYKFLNRVSHVDHELIYNIADISRQIKIFVVPLKVHQ